MEYLGVAVALGEPALALGGLDVAHETEAFGAELLVPLPAHLKWKGDSLTSLQENLCVSSIILIGRVLCKVTPTMPTWGLSPDRPDVPHRPFLSN